MASCLPLLYFVRIRTCLFCSRSCLLSFCFHRNGLWVSFVDRPATHTHQRVLRLWEKAETQQWVSHGGLNAYLTALPMKSGRILATTVLHINGCDMMESCLFCLDGIMGRFGSLFLYLWHIPTAKFNTMLNETIDKLPMICLAWKYESTCLL